MLPAPFPMHSFSPSWPPGSPVKPRGSALPSDDSELTRRRTRGESLPTSGPISKTKSRTTLLSPYAGASRFRLPNRDARVSSAPTSDKSRFFAPLLGVFLPKISPANSPAPSANPVAPRMQRFAATRWKSPRSSLFGAEKSRCPGPARTPLRICRHFGVHGKTSARLPFRAPGRLQTPHLASKEIVSAWPKAPLLQRPAANIPG